jgi:hypothetical protein
MSNLEVSMGSCSWSHKDEFFQDEESEHLSPVGNFLRQSTEPANSFSAYHRNEKEGIGAWPFHEQQEDIETTDTRDHSAPTSEATPTPPPEPESWSSWDQNAASNSLASHYLVPVLISSPCMSEQVPTPSFLGSMPMGYDQGQFMVPAPPKACSQSPPPDWGNTTTVMMRNLANKYTQRLLLSEVNESGFIGTFDFLYLPIDTDTNANKGYAFINFSESSFAWMFKQAFEGRRMHMFNSDKVVSVSAAALQGFDNNYAHYVNARCNRGDPACRPLFLRAPSSNIATKPVARSGRRNGRGHGRSNLDRLAETQQLQQQLELAVQALMTKQQHEQQQQQQQEEQPLQHATRFCPYCGNKAKVDFKFCPGCGSSLQSTD